MQLEFSELSKQTLFDVASLYRWEISAINHIAENKLPLLIGSYKPFSGQETLTFGRFRASYIEVLFLVSVNHIQVFAELMLGVLRTRLSLVELVTGWSWSSSLLTRFWFASLTCRIWFITHDPSPRLDGMWPFVHGWNLDSIAVHDLYSAQRNSSCKNEN